MDQMQYEDNIFQEYHLFLGRCLFPSFYDENAQ